MIEGAMAETGLRGGRYKFCVFARNCRDDERLSFLTSMFKSFMLVAGAARQDAMATGVSRGLKEPASLPMTAEVSCRLCWVGLLCVAVLRAA